MPIALATPIQPAPEATIAIVSCNIGTQDNDDDTL